jgi:hypothetical protein
MSSNECIIPECYIDSCLIEVLLYADRNHVNHQKGNGTVAREMKFKFVNAFCVGIIDQDRKQLDYLEEFNLAIDANDLKLWKHKSGHQYIIQICPVIEAWLLSACEAIGILLKNYNLPESLVGFKKEAKSIASKRDQRFVKLFKDMVKGKSESIIQLQNWLSYLKENQYNADINQLKNG